MSKSTSSLASLSDQPFQYNGRSLEPWQITTQDFGGRWGSCPCEKKGKVNPSSVRTLDDFMGRMHQFSVHTVEAIQASTFPLAVHLVFRRANWTLTLWLMCSERGDCCLPARQLGARGSHPHQGPQRRVPGCDGAHGGHGLHGPAHRRALLPPQVSGECVNGRGNTHVVDDSCACVCRIGDCILEVSLDCGSMQDHSPIAAVVQHFHAKVQSSSDPDVADLGAKGKRADGSACPIRE